MRTWVMFTSFLALFTGLLVACQGSTGNSPDYRNKGNPKLSSELNALVSADLAGQAASFAEQNNIALVEQKVRVIVEALPGQFDNAAGAAARLGTVETSYNNLIQAVVPLNNLETLAGDPAIRFIRLPLPVLPAAQENIVK